MKYEKDERSAYKADPALQGLARMRDAVLEEGPDMNLLARLTELHAVQANGHGRSERKAAWPLWFGLAVLTSGVAAAAGGGVQWMRQWWVSIEVDGERMHSAELGATSTDSLEGRADQLQLALKDGGSATVRIQSSQVESSGLEQNGPETVGERLQMQLIRRGADGGVQEQEVSDDVFGATIQRSIDAAIVSDSVHLHSGPDSSGRELHLFLVDAQSVRELLPENSGEIASATYVVALREDRAVPTAELIASLPAWTLAKGVARTEQRLDSGGITFRFARGQGLEAVWRWDTDSASPPAPEVILETDDGRIRVRAQGRSSRD